MSDETEDTLDYEILPPEEDVEVETTPQRAPRTVGYAMLGLATIFAALAGGIGGAAFSVATEQPTADLTALKRQVSIAEGENKTLKTQIAKLQRDIKAIPAPKSVDLSGIRARLEALENTEAPVIDAELVTRLEALQTEGTDVMDLSDIYTRLEALENRPVIIETPAVEVTDVTSIEPEILLPFPKAKVLAALDEADKSKGWFKRAMSKHISVQSEDNPRYLVELIEADIVNENLDAALEKFDKLPSQARSAAQDWRDNVGS